MLGHTRCCARFGPTSFSAAASRDFIDDATCSAGPGPPLVPGVLKWAGDRGPTAATSCFARPRTGLSAWLGRGAAARLPPPLTTPSLASTRTSTRRTRTHCEPK